MMALPSLLARLAHILLVHDIHWETSMAFSIFAEDAADHKKVKFHPRVLGSPAPMFPGYEVDISEPVDDNQKPDAVWHRERAKKMVSDHPEIKKLFGNTPSTAIWCVLFMMLQVGLALEPAEDRGG